MKKNIIVIAIVICLLILGGYNEKDAFAAETRADSIDASVLLAAATASPVEPAGAVPHAVISAADSGTIEITSIVTRDKKYNMAVAGLTQEEFESAGFRLGDSCDIIFGNGYTISDVPYYNGYYVKTGDPIVVAYPGFTNVSITYNNIGIWDTAGLVENDAVTVRLNESGKYLAIQDTLGQTYSDDFQSYGDIEQFCNFRALSGGSLKDDFLFRGASPVDNVHRRAASTDRLLEEHGIMYVINLADSEDDLNGYMAQEDFNSPYTAELHESGRVSLLDMSSGYTTEDYHKKLAAGLREMLESTEIDVAISSVPGSNESISGAPDSNESISGASEQIDSKPDVPDSNESISGASEQIDSKPDVPDSNESISSTVGPIYIHCTEGKDRTGFVCMLLEALAGATYDEMRADYMKTYQNYYFVSSEDTPEKYDAIAALYFDPFAAYLHGTEDIDVLVNADYIQDAADYLMAGGLTEAEVEQLREFITK